MFHFTTDRLFKSMSLMLLMASLAAGQSNDGERRSPEGRAYTTETGNEGQGQARSASEQRLRSEGRAIVSLSDELTQQSKRMAVAAADLKEKRNELAKKRQQIKSLEKQAFSYTCPNGDPQVVCDYAHPQHRRARQAHNARRSIVLQVIGKLENSCDDEAIQIEAKRKQLVGMSETYDNIRDRMNARLKIYNELMKVSADQESAAAKGANAGSAGSLIFDDAAPKSKR